MSERIWGVDDAYNGPKLESSEVVRRGPKLIRVKERMWAFGGRIDVPAAMAHATPEAAIAAFVKEKRAEAACLRERAQRFEDKAARAISLAQKEAAGG